jgi:amidase
VSGQDFTTALDVDALQGKRVGVWIQAPPPGPGEEIPEAELAGALEAFGYTKAVEGLEAAGAEVVLAFAPPLNQPAFLDVINNGLRVEFEDYIAQLDPDGPIGSIADVIAFNQEDEAVRAPFGEGNLVPTAASSLTQEEYDALATELRAEARRYVDDLFAAGDLDALVTKGNQFSNAYSMAGYPAITVPDGDLAQVSGVTFVGPYLGDAELIGLAYAWEQATNARTAPPID